MREAAPPTNSAAQNQDQDQDQDAGRNRVLGKRIAFRLVGRGKYTMGGYSTTTKKQAPAAGGYCGALICRGSGAVGVKCAGLARA